MPNPSKSELLRYNGLFRAYLKQQIERLSSGEGSSSWGDLTIEEIGADGNDSVSTNPAAGEPPAEQSSWKEIRRQQMRDLQLSVEDEKTAVSPQPAQRSTAPADERYAEKHPVFGEMDDLSVEIDNENTITLDDVTNDMSEDDAPSTARLDDFDLLEENASPQPLWVDENDRTPDEGDLFESDLSDLGLDIGEDGEDEEYVEEVVNGEEEEGESEFTLDLGEDNGDLTETIASLEPATYHVDETEKSEEDQAEELAQDESGLPVFVSDELSDDDLDDLWEDDVEISEDYLDGLEEEGNEEDVPLDLVTPGDSRTQNLETSEHQPSDAEIPVASAWLDDNSDSDEVWNESEGDELDLFDEIEEDGLDESDDLDLGDDDIEDFDLDAFLKQ